MENIPFYSRGKPWPNRVERVGATVLEVRARWRASPETVLARPADPKGAGPGMLTQREEEVLSALGEGSSNKRIAQRLGISERTVKAHLTNIYEKLGVETRTAAVALALRGGLLGPSGADE